MTLLIRPLALGFCLVACGPAAAQPQPTTGSVPSADGVLIEYEVHGEGEPALVLIPGWTNPRQIYGRHPETLGRSHRVVALDLAGHGVSGTDREEWTIDAFGEDVVSVVDHLCLGKVVLVGFSMGGAVAFEAAERMPERTLGIVLVDAMHDPDQGPPGDPDEMLATFRANWGNPEFLRAFGFTPDAPDSLVEYVEALYPPEPPEYFFETFRNIGDWIVTERTATLERNQKPVAAINTTRRPTDVEAWRRYAPSFTVDTLDGVGHAGILLQRVDDFDARLLSIVERFSMAMAGSPD